MKRSANVTRLLMNFPFTDRLDYLTSMGNNFGYALAVEQLMGEESKPPGWRR